VDAAGNIYIAGFQGTVGTPDSYDAFVTKLSPEDMGAQQDGYGRFHWNRIRC
jgi:hypothetical protein